MENNLSRSTAIFRLRFPTIAPSITFAVIGMAVNGFNHEAGVSKKLSTPCLDGQFAASNR
jgi:hypothetical protein